MLSVRVMDEEVAATETTAADEDEEEVLDEVKVKLKHLLRDQSTQTYLQVNGQGVKCTENSGAVHTFVLNQLHAHGRISTLHVPRNEVLTSLAAPIINQFMTHCTTTKESRK